MICVFAPCPLDSRGRHYYAFEIGDPCECGAEVMCLDCGSPEHDFISCQAAREVDERVERKRQRGTP